MMKEIILLLIFLFVVCVAIYQTSFQPSLAKELVTLPLRESMNSKKIDKKRVNFADFKTERVFNKNTGSIIEERISAI